MTAQSYNRKQYEAEFLTDDHVVKLVEYWQRGHDLTVDGYAGPNTIRSIAGPLRLPIMTIRKNYPLVVLADGRKPIQTSGFYTENPSRPNHKGADFFYEWLDTDPDMKIGDGGAILKNGKRRWWYPPADLVTRYGFAIAAAAGTVQIAGVTRTGWRCWVDHGNGERTGYFHLKVLHVEQGANVAAGQVLGPVGDNPRDRDAQHLHFEVSPADQYAPMNPRLWLRDAIYLEA